MSEKKWSENALAPDLKGSDLVISKITEKFVWLPAATAYRRINLQFLRKSSKNLATWYIHTNRHIHKDRHFSNDLY